MKRFFTSSIFAFLALFLLVSNQASAAQTSALLPVSAGNYQQWTPKTGSNHVTMVDEANCNGVTDYNNEITLTQRDSYGISVSSIPDGSTITQIDITPCASRNNTGSGTSTFDVFYRLNSVDSADAGAYALPTGTTPQVLSTTSFTGLSINKASTTAFEIGGVYSAGNRGVRLSQITTTITYTPLSTPSGLTALATGSAITLNWNDNSSNEDGFKIERSDNGGAFSEIASVSANVTTYNDPGLAVGTYAYRVRAYNSGGNSGYTATATAYSLAAPSGLTAVSTGSAVTVIWVDNASNEDGFKVERAVGAGSFVQYKTFGPNVRSFVDPSLAVNTYTYRVRAFKSTNSHSDYSNSDSAPILTAPSGFTATPSTDDLTLNWNDNATGEDNYVLERADNGGPSVVIATLSAGSTTYFDENLPGSSTYSYKVRATTVTGDQSGNAFVTFSFINAPTGLTAVAPGTTASGSAINLNWTDNASNEDGFKIEIASGGGSFSQYVFVAANATSYVTPTLPANNYSFRVRAYKGTSNSDYSNTADTVVLSAPSGLDASVAGSDVTLNWTDNSTGEDGFRIERADNGGSFVEINTVAAGVATYLDPGLASGSYEYRVRAYQGSNTSIYSATDTAVIP